MQDAQEGRRRSYTGWLGVFVFGLVLYVASMGPVHYAILWCFSKAKDTDDFYYKSGCFVAENIDPYLYYPLIWLAQHNKYIGSFLDWYVKLWIGSFVP